MDVFDSSGGRETAREGKRENFVISRSQNSVSVARVLARVRTARTTTCYSKFLLVYMQFCKVSQLL